MSRSHKLWALMLSAVLVGGCLAALAQEGANNQEAEHRLQQLTRDLNLTAQQQERLRPILERRSEDWMKVNDDKSLTEYQKRARMRDIQEKYKPEISEVLTPEQREKWKAMKH
jgi:periplasmic protein CpxP/Spy